MLKIKIIVAGADGIVDVYHAEHASEWCKQCVVCVQDCRPSKKNANFPFSTFQVEKHCFMSHASPVNLDRDY